MKLHEDSETSDFRSYIKKYRGSSQNIGTAEGSCNILRGALLEATGRSCGWTKGSAIHKETWWWDDNISNSVSGKQKLWIQWKHK